MVMMIQENAAISSCHHMSRAARTGSIVSQTCNSDHEKVDRMTNVSKSPQSVISAVSYTNSTTSIIISEIVSCDITSEQSKQKSVRFMMDPCDSRKHHCRTYSNSTKLTSIEKKNQWYTSAEIKRMRSETYSKALEARSTAKPYLQLFQRLHAVCNDSSSDVTAEKHLAHRVAASEYRGMESLTFVEIVRLNQRQNVKEVLAAQEDFRDLLTSEELMMELHALSIKLNRCSSRLAYMLAVGDANEESHNTAPHETSSTSLQNDQVEVKNTHLDDESHRTMGTPIDTSKYEI